MGNMSWHSIPGAKEVPLFPDWCPLYLVPGTPGEGPPAPQSTSPPCSAQPARAGSDVAWMVMFFPFPSLGHLTLLSLSLWAVFQPTAGISWPIGEPPTWQSPTRDAALTLTFLEVVQTA